MAKATKGVKRAGKAGAKKGAKKKSAKKGREGAGGEAPAMPGSPERVTTGSGAGVEEIGRTLVREFNRGNHGVTEKLWSPGIVSIEGGGLAWRGRKNVEIKNAGWSAENRVAGASAEGPYVGSTGFAVKFRIEVEDKASGRRTVMEEVGVYTVKNGKIVQEEFMYGSVRAS